MDETFLDNDFSEKLDRNILYSITTPITFKEAIDNMELIVQETQILE
jgi:hypothetical protein